MASQTPIKLAVLDDYHGAAATHFSKLEPDFEVKIFQDTLPPYNSPSTTDEVKEQLVERLKPFTVICTMRERTPFPGALLERLPNLKLLHSTGKRNLSLDLETAKQRGILVHGASGVSAGKSRGPDNTTQHCVALVLGIARNLSHDDATVKAGGWQTVFATGLGGKTYGCVGLGRLGVNVAKILHLAFDMKIKCWSSNLTQEAADEKAKSAGLPIEDQDGEKTFKVVSKEDLFQTADVVSLHYVLSDRSRGLVSATDLALMKPSALFVNTSRGPLVVEKDLLDILKQGKIRGAALDVFDLEPLPSDSEWRTTKWGSEGRSQVLLTPHMAFVEGDAINAWHRETVENVLRWKRGEALKESLY
ncbi:d-isomer specific 2-hydroxyacid dehydrogenase [Phlyctema vagabunda]|uniref:D-isomer specific 2-hydroxyacid dehydrogenase n=1 Tax=Phlyctema vagabunda TaxID=108571 RepID=A0ABR4PPC0_9HELO